MPEGDYRVRIAGVKLATSQCRATRCSSGPSRAPRAGSRGRQPHGHTALTSKAAWSLRDLIVAVYGRVPKGDLERAAPRARTATSSARTPESTLEDDEYTNEKGKTYVSSRSADWLSLDDLDGKLDDERDDDEKDDEAEDDGLDDMDRAALKAHIKLEGLDVRVLKPMDDDSLRAAIREASRGEDDSRSRT